MCLWDVSSLEHIDLAGGSGFSPNGSYPGYHLRADADNGLLLYLLAQMEPSTKRYSTPTDSSTSTTCPDIGVEDYSAYLSAIIDFISYLRKAVCLTNTSTHRASLFNCHVRPLTFYRLLRLLHDMGIATGKTAVHLFYFCVLTFENNHLRILLLIMSRPVALPLWLTNLTTSDHCRGTAVDADEAAHDDIRVRIR